MIRHLVLLKFTKEATAERRDQMSAAFGSLADQIPEIRSLEWGLNASPEGLDKGFTHCFLVTFDDEAARDAYLPHPAHQAFVSELKPWLLDVLVLDYAAT
ncbi:Dabb family protein [Piscinibacter terrae]|uniref:Dabb family protein n=1 Tax=Piscinibacter terrae TaxID=2496871 RepID=A0A3N7JKR2_9BURK|nr:Dabb family protein [Albitalea terrae]RQP21889.1 Dabb family protein [Albitalea terrae]